MQHESMTEAERKKLNDELKKKKKAENKANSLIVWNIGISVFCRLPELIGIFYYFLNTNTNSQVFLCYANIFCYLLADTLEYFYMLSYSLSIFVYYRFNSNFQRGFRSFFVLKNKKNTGNA